MLLLPIGGLLAAAALYSAAEGATICLDFADTCEAREAGNAPMLRVIALVIAIVADVALFLVCSSVRRPLRLVLASDDSDEAPGAVVKPGTSAIGGAIAVVTAVALILVGALVGTNAGVLAALFAGPPLAMWQLPYTAGTKAFYAGVVVFLILAVLVGGPFIAVAFVLIMVFVLALGTLLANVSLER